MSVVLKIAVGILRLVYAPIKLFPRRKKIAILSRQGNEKSQDIMALEECIHSMYPDVKLTVLVKMVGGAGYAFHMLRQMYAIATSRAVVVDGYCIAASVLNHKRGTKIIQMWHSSAAIKKFGYQCLDKESGHSSKIAEIMRMHRNYDYVICPSVATGRMFCKGFDVPESVLRLYGLPRLEQLVRSRKEEVNPAEDADADNREIVLYVPTLRKVRPVDAASLAGAIDSDKYRLVVRLHPLDEIDDSCEEAIDFGREYSTSQWLNNCDYIVTDYSALGIEGMLLDKPMFFYVYDIEEYERETGLNINPLEEMSWCSSTDAGEIAAMLENEYDFSKLTALKEKYIEVNPENCTERLAQFIVETADGNN